MRASQFEIYRLVQRAMEALGAGYGVDRDAARMTAWLEARGLPGLVIGHIVAHKSGHALNAQMVSKLLNTPQSWLLVGSTPEAAISQPEQFQHATL